MNHINVRNNCLDYRISTWISRITTCISRMMTWICLLTRTQNVACFASVPLHWDRPFSTKHCIMYSLFCLAGKGDTATPFPYFILFISMYPIIIFLTLPYPSTTGRTLLYTRVKLFNKKKQKKTCDMWNVVIVLGHTTFDL